MADNASLTAGDGTLVAAADDIGGIKHQRVKLEWGVDGVAVDTSASDPLPVSLLPIISGGLSIYRNLDMGNTGAAVKTTAGQIYGWYLSNNASANRFVKLYDKASAASSADTPIMTIQLPAGTASNIAFPTGIACTSGISVRASTGIADNDTGAPTTNDVIVNLVYK